ncbi:MAG TPA: hypothetical protein VGL15_00055 [Vicinamibacteria bacterium]
MRHRPGFAFAVAILGLTLLVAVAAFVAEGMVEAGAGRLLVASRSVLIGSATAVLLSAAAVQVLLGRADVRRRYLALSAVTLGGLLLCVLGLAAYGRWVTSAAPEDLLGAVVDAAPAGEWFAVAGGTRRTKPPSAYTPAFLIDDTARQRVGLGGIDLGLGPLAWSADGRRVAWIGAGLRRSEIASAWVDVPDATITRVPVARGPGQGALEPVALSRDGQRLLVQERSTLRLIEVDTGRETGRGESDPVRTATFLRDGSARLVVSPRGRPSDAEVSLCDWDFRGNRVDARWTLTTEGGARVHLTPDGEHLLLVDRRGLALYAADGRRTATLIDAWSGPNHLAGFLFNRSVLAVEDLGSTLRLRVFAPDGQSRVNVTLPGSFPARFAGEPAAGLVSIGIEGGRSGGGWETIFVDTAAGEVRRREPGLRPAGNWEGWRWSAGDTSTVPAPGSAGTRLFWGPGHALLWVDPLSGARRALLTTAGDER